MRERQRKLDEWEGGQAVVGVVIGGREWKAELEREGGGREEKLESSKLERGRQEVPVVIDTYLRFPEVEAQPQEIVSMCQ